MDALTRCENGHYYDSQKHSSCPFCGVQNLDIDIKKTMAMRPNNNSGPSKETGSGGKTVGVFRKKLGIDPVVGWLVAVEGPEKGNDYRITSERNFIGRSEKMDISIPGDETISRENHAIVSYNPKNNSFRFFPGESRGLVYLNDEEVITPVELNPYDQIEIGETKLKFVPFCGEQFRWKDKEEQA